MEKEHSFETSVPLHQSTRNFIPGDHPHGCENPSSRNTITTEYFLAVMKHRQCPQSKQHVDRFTLSADGRLAPHCRVGSHGA